MKIKLAYSSYELESLVSSFPMETRINMLSTDITYNLTQYIDIGGYLGYTLCEEWTIYEESETSISMSSDGYASGIAYGLVSNFHYLPLLTKNNKLRFDLYINARFGSNYLFTSKDAVPERGAYFEYGLYAGAAYYFGQHWGAFFEYGFSNSYNMRYGLALKF